MRLQYKNVINEKLKPQSINTNREIQKRSHQKKKKKHKSDILK